MNYNRTDRRRHLLFDMHRPIRTRVQRVQLLVCLLKSEQFMSDRKKEKRLSCIPRPQIMIANVPKIKKSCFREKSLGQEKENLNQSERSR